MAQDLDALYEYMSLRLVNANLNNDVEGLDEVARLLSEIKEAWDSIRPVNNLPLTAVPTTSCAKQTVRFSLRKRLNNVPAP